MMFVYWIIIIVFISDGNVDFMNSDERSQIHRYSNAIIINYYYYHLLYSPVEISESRLSGSQTSLIATIQPKV